MIEAYFKHPPVLRFLRPGAIGEHIDAFAGALVAARFAARTARSQLPATQRRYYAAGGRRFLAWAPTTGLATGVRRSAAVPPLISEFDAWMVLHKNVAVSGAGDGFGQVAIDAPRQVKKA